MNEFVLTCMEYHYIAIIIETVVSWDFDSINYRQETD